jgi:serine/threonine-protein kinase
MSLPDMSRTRAPIDATSVLASPASSGSSSGDSQRRVHLVEGSEQGATSELNSLLRSRLRSAALVLASGMGLFLVWYTVQLRFDTPAIVAAYGMHWVATLGCLYAGFSLCRRCTFSQTKLRLFEVAIFGMVAAMFAVGQYAWTTYYAEKHMFNRNMGTWHVLIFTYALLIPNSWRRALPMLSVFALAPIVVTILAWSFDSASATLFASDPTYLVELFMGSGVSMAVALTGIHSINVLRTQVFEAKQIGQYRLKQLLGTGGMGEVYLAEHRMMKRPCAIKLIRPDKAGDPLTLARFEREVRATAKLSHWNTIDIYDYGRTDDGTFYYVMEYLPGMNLNELVRKFGPMPADRVVYLMRQACDALTEAHQLDLVHRDIKPANIFSAVRGGLYDVIKLLDFGLAKPMHSVEGSGITQEGSITGSPLFMSPEQATGEREPDMRSDIYSLGAVMYFLLTGRPPFDHDKPLKVIIAHAHDAPPPMSQFAPDIPEDLQQIVMRCLEKNPDDRYQDAEHLMLALDSCSAARTWTRTRAAGWWTERCSDGVCYYEPPITTADLSVTHDSVTATRS